MTRVRWDERPGLVHPVGVVAFEGWGDAGRASSSVIDHLLDLYDGERIAWIEGDDLCDYQDRRPLVELEPDGSRRIVWPDVEIYRLEVDGRDVVAVVGPEPHTRWRSFVGELIQVFRELGVVRVATLGAFIGQVPHTLPVPLVGTASTSEMLERHGILRSNYEGPTGIVGVLTQALIADGIPTVSIWAAVPHYVSTHEYPPAALALLRKAAEVLELTVDVSDLALEVDEFRAELDSALDDPELRSYVKELEADSLGIDTDPGERLVQEIERFLREG
jgi:proteasome assembly chaperone (PAC2) family protein